MTSEGLEKSYALLLLSPWRLCERLLPLLQNHDRTARIINVVSGGMYAERLNLKRLNMTSDGYRGARAYAQCKRALSIMTEVWAERWQDHNIVVNAMHPGWSDTPGVQKSLPLFRRLTRLVLRSHAEGADTVVWMAQSNQAALSTANYFWIESHDRPTYWATMLSLRTIAKRWNRAYNTISNPRSRTRLNRRSFEQHQPLESYPMSPYVEVI